MKNKTKWVNLENVDKPYRYRITCTLPPEDLEHIRSEICGYGEVEEVEVEIIDNGK